MQERITKFKMAAPPASFTADGSVDNAHETASTYEARVHTGAHQLRISPYSAAEEIAAAGGSSSTITSDEFMVGGHRWAITYHPDGFWASESRGYVSVFLSLSSSGTGRAGGVRVAAEIGLVDRERCAVAHAREFSHAFRRRGESWGFRQFLRRADLAASDCLAGDCVVVRCVVRVVEGEERAAGEGALASVRVPPSDLGRDLGGALLRDGVGADVTFVVGGRAFRAHRCVLAARSPVLRAELYGEPMTDATDTEGVIEVREMDPAVFAAVLHFIYTDTLPPETTDASRGVNVAQHLLAAADRYAMGRLSLACQDRLARHVDASTAAATYALASRHGAPGLKAAVLEFMARRRGRTEAVAASDGFRRLERADPAVAEEMVSRAAAARRWTAAREVPATCVRFAGEVWRSCVRWLAGVWACFVRLLEMACAAYMRQGEAPTLLDIAELPEIIDGVITLYHGMKRLMKKVVEYILR